MSQSEFLINQSVYGENGLSFHLVGTSNGYSQIFSLGMKESAWKQCHVVSVLVCFFELSGCLEMVLSLTDRYSRA